MYSITTTPLQTTPIKAPTMIMRGEIIPNIPLPKVMTKYRAVKTPAYTRYRGLVML